MRLVSRLVLIFAIAAIVSAAHAAESNTLLDTVRANLEKKYPNTRIEFVSQPEWLRGAAPETTSEVVSEQVGDDNGRGDVQYQIQYRDGGEETHTSLGHVTFQALARARTAVRRVQPGEKLQADAFQFRDIDVAAGQYRDFRGVLLGADQNLTSLESRQTILEGQPILTTAVQKVPDIRRGDSVRIQIVSGGLTLSTLGTAAEPAYLGSTVRVVSTNTKRELAGKLVSAGVVEVKI